MDLTLHCSLEVPPAWCRVFMGLQKDLAEEGHFL